MRKPLVIGLSGYAQSGKDTVAKFLVDNHGYQRFAFADALKESLLALDPLVGVKLTATVNGRDRRVSETVKAGGWEIAKRDPEVRRLLQRLGTEVGREILGEDIWVQIVARRIAQLPTYVTDGGKELLYPKAVITDCRFMNEANWVLQEDGLMVRVRRPGTEPVNQHSSETALDGWDFDFFVDNDGTMNDLEKKAARLASLAEGGITV